MSTTERPNDVMEPHILAEIILCVGIFFAALLIGLVSWGLAKAIKVSVFLTNL
jgi:hypothetical protein